jgi:hypothetical protein
MNSKFRIPLAIATFLFILSGSLIALNNVNNAEPLQYAKAQATDPTAPVSPGVKLPTATTSGQTNTTTSTTASGGTTTTGNTSAGTTTGQAGGINVTPPPTPNISNAGLLDGVIPATTSTTATTTSGASSTTNQAAVNTTNTVRTGGLATTGILLLAAAGAGIYYYQKKHKQSKFALKMSEKKIGGRK